MMWHDGLHTFGWGWGAGVPVMILMLLVWVGVVLGVVALVRYAGRPQGFAPPPPPPADRTSDALRILDERFARSEIDAEEYTARRDLLRNR